MLQVQVLSAEVEFIDHKLAKTLQISSGLITAATEARARVRLRVNGGPETEGRGSIYLGDLWSWPDQSVPREQRDAELRSLTREVARRLPQMVGDAAHPLELGLRLHEAFCHTDRPPRLACAMCASPFDAAIHDGTGLALDRSAFSFYDEPVSIPSGDALFPGVGVVESIRQILRLPVNQIDSWWLISAHDDLAKEVEPNVRRGGYGCFKLKILAKDPGVDAQRTAEVFRFLLQIGVSRPRLSVDSNEGNSNAASVLEYLERLRQLDPQAFAALEYLEQPTHRDLIGHPNDWHAVGRLKPVLLDEGMSGFDVLPVAAAQGWSGLALKTCKGHSFSLVAAAWASQHGLLLSLQDLGNPGFAAIHSFLYCSHIATINDAEINSPQYSPAANSEWMPRLGGLFEPKGGRHHLDVALHRGLGSNL